MSGLSDWFVGGRIWETQTPNIDGSDEDVTAPLGGVYLIHPTDTLDMLARLVLAMLAAAVPDAVAIVTETRRIRISASAVFAITWNTATGLRDLLGFGADLAGADTYLAPAISPLLWAPGKRATPELAQRGAQGKEIADMTATIGAQGRIFARQEGSPSIRQRWSMRHVAENRYRSDRQSHTPGEYSDFWREQLLRARPFVVLEAVLEGDDDTSIAGYEGLVALGPYKADLAKRGMVELQFARSAGFLRCEAFYDVAIDGIVTPEFSP